jgi:hypothetical protein
VAAGSYDGRRPESEPESGEIPSRSGEGGDGGAPSPEAADSVKDVAEGVAAKEAQEQIKEDAHREEKDR